MGDFIVAIIILAILGSAITYIIKEKKKGVKCIGCPAAANCAKRRARSDFNCGHHS